MCQNVIYFASSNLLKYAMFRAREKLLLFQKYILLTKLKSNDVNFSKKVTLNWQKMKLAYNELWIIYKKKDEKYWIRVY